MSFLNSLIVKIKGDNSDLKKSLDDSEGAVGKFGGSINKLGGLLKGAFTVAAIATFIKSVINASEALSDKFTFAVAGAKGALTEFFRMVGTGDFSNFLNGLSEGYEKAHKLAEELDALNDTKAYAEYKTSGMKTESARLEGIVRDQTGIYSLDERKKAAIELKKIEEQIRNMTDQVNQEIFDLEKQAWENRNKMNVDEAIKLYESVNSLSKEEINKLQNAFEGATKNYLGVRKQGIKSVLFGQYDPQLTKDFAKDVLEDFAKYFELMETGEVDILPKLFKSQQTYNESLTQSQERFNSILRITNALLKEQEQIITDNSTKQKINPVANPNANLGTGTTSLSQIIPSASLAPAPKIGINKNLKEEVTEMQRTLTNARDMALDLGSELVEALGSALAGGNTKDIGRSLLASFANFLSQFGKMLLLAGLGIEAFVKSTATLNAPLAIAAGIAMMLAAGAVKGVLSNASKNVASGSGGGGGYGGGGYSAQSGPQTIVIKGELRGRDIFWSNKRYESELKSNT